MSQLIEIKNNILGGTPVIKGTRIPVARIMALIGMNYRLHDVLREYPQLKNYDSALLEDFITSLRSTFSHYRQEKKEKKIPVLKV